MLLPPDSALGPWPLTDPEAVARLLLLTGAAVDPGRIRYLEHDVGSSLLVHYQVTVAGHQRDVVVSTGRLRWSAGAGPGENAGDRTAEQWPTAAADLAGRGVPRPAAEIDGVTVAWYPFDPGLPALAHGLEDCLHGPIQRLAWMPQRRAVLTDGTRVAKVEADAGRLQAGIDTLERLGPVVAVPRVLAVVPERGIYLQERLAGRPLGPPDALAWAAPAGELAARIENSGLDNLPLLDPPVIEAQAHPVLRLVAHAAPDLTPRIAALAAQISRAAPTYLALEQLRPAHGDYNAGQLLARPDGTLGLVDTDTLCLAPPGYDLAAYATNLLSGRPGDLDTCDAVAGAVARSHGRPPPELAWLTAATALRRLDRPVRRYKRRWRPRLEQLLADVEALAARL